MFSCAIVAIGMEAEEAEEAEEEEEVVSKAFEMANVDVLTFEGGSTTETDPSTAFGVGL
tara:strand:- start:315 stop:491 length:177 start_codon:yes stop_codon:yes gene_type:complete